MKLRALLVTAIVLVLGCADGTPVGADMGIPPPPGAGDPVPPPDKPGAPPEVPDPPPKPDEVDPEAEPPPPEGDPPPEGEVPADDCRGIDYTGVCHGTLAVWCEENELYAFDCAEEGLECGFAGEDLGYYCIEEGGQPPEQQDPEPQLPPEGEMPPEGEQPPPDLPPEGEMPPGGDPPPADPCPGVDWFGRCEGNTAVWCDDEEEILRFDCTWIGMECRDLGFLGHRCIVPEGMQNPQDPQNPGG